MEKKKRDWIPNPNGRPRNEEKQYRKKLHRFSKFEDAILDIVSKFESEKDKKLVLEKMKSIR